MIAATGAPRGSLYHHLPGGKEQLVAAAVERAGAYLLAALGEAPCATPAEVLERFLAVWRAVLLQTEFGSGCAVLAVTVAAESADQLGDAMRVFRAWRGRLAMLLRGAGQTPAAADALAAMMIAAVEGAVVLCRAEQSIAPFEAVASQLRVLVAPGR